VLADDREQVSQKGPVLLGELAGDLADRRGGAVGTAVGADPGVALAILGLRGLRRAVGMLVWA
jgi:hypothetical protein